MTAAKVNDDQTQDALDTAADGVRDAVNKTADAVSDEARKGSREASESVGSAIRAVNDAVDTAQQNVSAGLHHASEVASDIGDKATGALDKYPVRTVLPVAVGAAVVGFIVGVVTPKRS